MRAVFRKKGIILKTTISYLMGISAAAIMSVTMFATSASAGVCASTTDCTFNLTQGNTSSGFGTGDFGTVNLSLNTATHAVTFTIDLASGFLLSGGNGFPGDFGFNDNVGGGLTYGGFPNGYSGGDTNTAASDQHFDGFGSFDDYAASTHPVGPGGLNVVSFTVSKGSALTDVNQLVGLSSGGSRQVYFTADVCKLNASGTACSGTGLVGAVVAPVPEPASYLTLFIVGFGILGFIAQRRKRNSQLT
jgi:hypothetical protein